MCVPHYQLNMNMVLYIYIYKHFSEIHLDKREYLVPTCLESGVIRFKLLMEMFRLMLMPANCRLLFPRILESAFEGGLREEDGASEL